MLATLVVVYAGIAYFFVRLLLGLSRRWRREDLAGEPEVRHAPEVGIPYGPRPAAEP